MGSGGNGKWGEWEVKGIGKTGKGEGEERKGIRVMGAEREGDRETRK